jgi:myo-inositol-1(or 4)-monophosphatase
MMMETGDAELNRFAAVGNDITREAGAFLMKHFRTNFSVSHKGAINLVTEVDVAAEELIVSRLNREFPEHVVLAEENHSEGRPGDYRWVVDPLDGTTNYAHGFPFFSVSMALEIWGEVVWGAVYNPAFNEMFTARLGCGAQCNGVPIHVSSIGSLSESFLATGFPYDIRTSSVNNLDYFREFTLRALAIRRAGSAALDLSYVAAGRFDGFWELKLHPWDCGAGYLMVREAGGIVTDFSGEQGSIYVPECLATNGLIHEQMLMIFRDLAALTTGRSRS